MYKTTVFNAIRQGASIDLLALSTNRSNALSPNMCWIDRAMFHQTCRCSCSVLQSNILLGLEDLDMKAHYGHTAIYLGSETETSVAAVPGKGALIASNANIFEPTGQYSTSLRYLSNQKSHARAQKWHQCRLIQVLRAFQDRHLEVVNAQAVGKHAAHDETNQHLLLVTCGFTAPSISTRHERRGVPQMTPGSESSRMVAVCPIQEGKLAQ